MAVYTPLTDTDAARIAATFGLGEVRELEGIAKGSVNTNYRMVTPEGAFFVRIDERRGPADLEFETALLAHLQGKGFPSPPPRPTSEGRLFGEHAGKPVMVFPYLPGADRPARDYREADLIAVGTVLAQLHLATDDFSRTHENRFGFAAVQAMWADSRDAAQKAVPEAVALIDEEIDALALRLADAEVPRGLVHGDVFADNVLFLENGEISGILDFEAACTEARPFDLATAINALAWPEVEPEPAAARIDALLLGYDRVRPRPHAEEVALPLFGRLSALRFSVTRIRDFVLTPPPDGGRVEKDYANYIRRLRWWRSHA